MGEQEMLGLAERCEKATGPDRGLDGDIALAVGEVPAWATARPNPQRQPELFTDGCPGLRARTWLPAKYTRSLDAAMTLVPEGWRFEVTTTGFKPGASLVTPRGTFGPYGAYAATPALALCAAALRARASSEQIK